MITFKTLRWKNFLSTGNAFTEIKLDRSPNTLIIGENGGGKSTMLDALCFGLFGKPFRNINKPQLLNSINKKNLIVEIEFSAGGKNYKIVRGIRPNIFEIYSGTEIINQDAASRDYQKYLEQQILKLNYRSFTQVVILGSSAFVPFMELKSPHRREVVEDILDIKIFSVMNMLVKIQIKEIQDQLRDIDREIDITKNKVETQERYIEQTGKQTQSTIDDYNKKIQENKDALNKYNDHKSELEKVLNKEKEKILDENKVREQVKRLNAFETQFETKVNECTKHKKFYEAHDNCPTCQQTIDPQFKSEKISKENNQMLKFNQALEDVAKEIYPKHGKGSFK